MTCTTTISPSNTGADIAVAADPSSGAPTCVGHGTSTIAGPSADPGTSTGPGTSSGHGTGADPDTSTGHGTGADPDTSTDPGPGPGTGSGAGTVAPARSWASFASDPASHHSLVRLQREWGHLARSPEALAAARGWALHVVPFRSLDDLLIATGLGMRGRAGDHDDELVGQLVVLARDHVLAGRVVLQRLLPGLAAIARRRTMGAHTTVLLETTDELLAAAWAVIRSYRVERYPTFVVPSMLREIERRTFRPERRRRFEVVAVGDEVLERTAAPEQRPTAAQEIADLLADAARSGLDPADIELVRRLAAGATSAELAVEHDVTDRTIRNHRAAAIHRLRAVALASG
jgi:DNA-binding CsgD family transcriptional regulator